MEFVPIFNRKEHIEHKDTKTETGIHVTAVSKVTVVVNVDTASCRVKTKRQGCLFYVMSFYPEGTARFSEAMPPAQNTLTPVFIPEG